MFLYLSNALFLIKNVHFQDWRVGSRHLVVIPLQIFIACGRSENFSELFAETASWS